MAAANPPDVIGSYRLKRKLRRARRKVDAAEIERLRQEAADRRAEEKRETRLFLLGLEEEADRPRVTCGCNRDYLTLPLENPSEHRCPNPIRRY